MAGSFVVEMETTIGIDALMTDRHQTSIAAQPLGINRRFDGNKIGLWGIDRFQRLPAEAIQQIHQQQFLVLLFVMQTKLRQLDLCWFS